MRVVLTSEGRSHFCIHLYLQKRVWQCFGHCINITKLIESYYKCTFPFSVLKTCCLCFPIQTSKSLKLEENKNNFFTLGWSLQSGEKQLWCHGLSAAYHQFRFWQRKRKSGYTKWKALPWGQCISRILVLRARISILVSLFLMHIAPFLKSCSSRNWDFLLLQKSRGEITRREGRAQEEAVM